MYLIDYHTHTPRCNHAVGSLDEYISKAIELKFDEYGVNDHATMVWLPEESRQRNLGMQPEELPDYINDVKAAREKYADKIKIKLGLEVDYYKDIMEKMKNYLTPYLPEFDYLYGSVHVMKTNGLTWGTDDGHFQYVFDEIGTNKVFIQYYSELIDMINTGFFDIVGHMDIPKKFKRIPEDVELVDSHALKVLDAAKKKDIAIEINTSGFRKPCKEQYPSDKIIKQMAEMEIPIVIGSDSHEPGTVGMDIERCLKLYKSFGGKKICSFTKRVRTEIPLD